MRNMKKHDFHQNLERAEEVAILLQHRIARQTDQLLQTNLSVPEDNSVNRNRLSEIFKGVLGTRSILSRRDDDVISFEKTGPELHHEA
jgi:hypothetical protein